MNKKLEISIILFSNKGREINFRELKSSNCCLEEEEMTPFFFWGATGGFELTVDGYKTIFRGFDFYVAIEAIRFLLNSLHWLEGKTSGYNVDEEFPEAVVSRFPNDNFIKLSRKENGILCFSYQSTLPQFEETRETRFFNEELFLSKDWAEAVRIGLKEYFDVLNPILRDNPKQEQSKILTDYLLNEWEYVKG
jgi:hypothetical protein